MLIVERIDSLLSKMWQTRVELCKSTGIKTQTVSHWYTRGSIPKADDAVQIAHYLGVSVEYLIFGTEEAGKNEAEEAEFLARWRKLSKVQKEAVCALMAGFEACK